MHGFVIVCPGWCLCTIFRANPFVPPTTLHVICVSRYGLSGYSVFNIVSQKRRVKSQKTAWASFPFLQQNIPHEDICFKFMSYKFYRQTEGFQVITGELVCVLLSAVLIKTTSSVIWQLPLVSLTLWMFCCLVRSQSVWKISTCVCTVCSLWWRQYMVFTVWMKEDNPVLFTYWANFIWFLMI